MMTRSDSGKIRRALFAIGNSLELRYLTMLVTQVPTFFFVNGYLHIIQMKEGTFWIYAYKVYIRWYPRNKNWFLVRVLCLQAFLFVIELRDRNDFVSNCFYDDLGEGSGASPISLLNG